MVETKKIELKEEIVEEAIEVVEVREVSEETVVTEVAEVKKEEVNNLPAVTGGDETAERTGKKSKRTRKKKEEIPFDTKGDFSPLKELAVLLNKPLEEIIDECALFQLQKLMAKMGKVVVRYDISDSQLEGVLLNAKGLCIDEILLAPLHVENMRKHVRKHKLEEQKVGVVIDFPFGESTLKTKMVSINEARKDGVDSVTVMMPSILLQEENKKLFLKQIKKIGKAFQGERGIAIPASDLTAEVIEDAVKMVEKTKLDFIALVFGATDTETLVHKMQAVNAVNHSKKIKVLGNVDTANAVIELFKANTDIILTPFADEIGKELVKRFNIKSLKLV